MILKKIFFKNIRGIEEYEFTFENGINQISMGINSGKSAIIDAIKQIFSFEEPSGDFFRTKSADTVITAHIDLQDEAYCIEKKWYNRILIFWNVSIKDSGKRLNLMEKDDMAEWMKQIGRHLYKQVIADFTMLYSAPGEEMPWDLFYNNCLNLTWMPSDRFIASPDPAVYLRPFFHGYERMVQNIENVKRVYRNRSESARQRRLLKQTDQKISERLHKELMDIEHSVSLLVARRAHCQNQWEAVRKEIQKKHHLNEYLSEKKRTLENIEYEITTIKKFLSDSFYDLSDEEYQELQAGKKKYEALTGRIREKEGQRIEKKHLQKNYDGIREEAEKLKKQAVAADTGNPPEIEKQLRLYTAEMKRIQKQLEEWEFLDEEIAGMKNELEVYEKSYDRYMIIIKTKEILSRNERKKILANIEKLESQRIQTQKEIEELEQSPLMSGIENAERRETEFVQQIRQAEYELKMQEERKNGVLSRLHQIQSGNVSNDESSGFTGRYILWMSETTDQYVTYYKRRLFSQFHEYLNIRNSIVTQNEATRALLELFTAGEPDTANAALPMSDSERLFFGIIIKLHFMEYFFGWNLIIIDEHAAQLIPENKMIAIQQMVSYNNILQMIYFSEKT